MRLKQAGDDSIELRLSLSQVKKIYLALFRQLHKAGADGFDALDEDDMLLTLQTYLQNQARQAGVDATNHAEWDAFLGACDGPDCPRRRTGRGCTESRGAP